MTPSVGNLCRNRDLAALAAWASRYPYDHFMLFTFAEPRRAEWAKAYFEKHFVPRLAGRVAGRVSYLGGVEAGPLNETIHGHCCLHGTAALSLGDICAQWRLGIASVSVYDPSQGGVAYVMKDWFKVDNVHLLDDPRLGRRPGPRGRRSMTLAQRVRRNLRVVRRPLVDPAFDPE